MPLTIEIPGVEMFNNLTQEFITVEPTTLVLEHSLISISKWEAKWKVPYIDTKDKTREQQLDYIRCMSLKGNISDDVLKSIASQEMKQINDYINDSMTATEIKNTKSSASNQYTTSELIYSWMVGYQIPVEFEKWHLSRLLTLIKVLSEENKPKKKMTPSEISARNKALNAKNRAKYHSRG